MEPRSHLPNGGNGARTNYMLGGLAVLFIGLATLFAGSRAWLPPPKQDIPLVDPKFLETTPWRRTYADLVKAKEDLSDYDCYGCHDKKNPPKLKFDANHRIIVPEEHSSIVMDHGSHDRNNLCFNCHNEQNLVTLQSRDGRELRFDNIPSLCGSCHGPTYRDWEAGAHGRTSGYWDRGKGDIARLSCANCHNPHSPQIPKRETAPGPHTLHPADKSSPSGAPH